MLTVDPTHLRELRSRPATLSMDGGDKELIGDPNLGSDRRRRIRDAVEAALSDIILLGTEEHVRLASKAIEELVAGRQVPTHDLVVSLRDFIRKALEIEPMPRDLVLPRQGPARPAPSSSKGKGEREGGDADGKGGRQAGGFAGGGGGGTPSTEPDDSDSAEHPGHRQ